MITINLAGIYLFLCKLSATICLISAATYGILMLAGVDIWNDESIWTCIGEIMATAFAASIAILIILLLALVIYTIWKL